MTAVTGTFPDPNGDGTVDWCIECWAEAVDKSRSPLTREEAVAWGISEHTDTSNWTDRACQMTGRSVHGVRVLRKRAHMKHNGQGDDLPEMPACVDMLSTGL